VEEGRTGTQMTAWKTSAAGLSDREIDRIVKYLTRERPLEKPEPFGFSKFKVDITHGEELYKIRCALCHGKTGEGGEGFLGVSLRNPVVQKMADPDFLAITLRDGRNGTPMAPFGKKGVGLGGQSIADVVAYVRTLSNKFPHPPDNPLVKGGWGRFSMDSGIDSGKRFYEERCMICHGTNGDGNGLVGVIRMAEKTGRVLKIYAMDFTMGVFKLRTTPTGCLPTDEDIMNIITNGIPRSFMPSHNDVSLEEKKAVKEYIKAFSPRWEDEDPCEPIPVKKPEWVGNSGSVVKGEKIYNEMKCGECHGEKGKGDGPKADKLKDDRGNQILPFNFITGALKRGSSPENVYITFTTGLDGTGMPSYEDSLNEEDRWHLVSYTLRLMGQIK